MSIVATDRYQALGVPYPEPETMCPGQCDGVGWFPVSEGDAEYGALWLAAHKKSHSLRDKLRIAIKYRDPKWLFHRCDGWHAVTCPDCGGSGRAA